MIIYVLLVACLSASCVRFDRDEEGSSVDQITRDTAAPIQTDNLAYELVRDSSGLGWETRIIFSFLNRSSDTLRIFTCGDSYELLMQKRTNSTWVGFWGPVVSSCLSLPIRRIPPGGIFADTLEVWGAPPDTNVAPSFPDTLFRGVYRLVWSDLGRGDDSGGAYSQRMIPADSVYSNSFVLRKRSR